MMTTDLERRVERLEKHLPKRSWLDEPAELCGEPLVMGDKFPIYAKIWALSIIAIVAIGLGLMIYEKFADTLQNISNSAFSNSR